MLDLFLQLVAELGYWWQKVSQYLIALDDCDQVFKIKKET